MFEVFQKTRQNKIQELDQVIKKEIVFYMRFELKL